MSGFNEPLKCARCGSIKGVEFHERLERRLCSGCIPPIPASTLTPFTDIVAKPVRFLWRDRIALAKITGLSGRPKIGKGLVYSRLIADLTRGTLDGDLTGPQRAIIVTTEDEPGDTLKPRLMAAGADLELVSMFTMGSKEDPIPFRVPGDADELKKRVNDWGALLVVIDPLMEFLDGKVDAHKSKDARHAVAAINEIARETGCAVLSIIHLNKGASTDAHLRHEGSAAFTQVIRGGLMLGYDPEDPDGEEGDQRVLAVSSSNLAKLAPSLAFRIEGRQIMGDTGEGISTAAMQCIGESPAASHQLLGGREDDDQKAERDEATEFLLSELEDGPCVAGDIQAAAKRAGIGSGALRRARRELKVSSTRQGFGGKGAWLWELPKGDGPKVADHLAEIPTPLTPMGSRAKSEGSKGAKDAKGVGYMETTPLATPLEADDDLAAEAERLAAKFPKEAS